MLLFYVRCIVLFNMGGQGDQVASAWPNNNSPDNSNSNDNRGMIAVVLYYVCSSCHFVLGFAFFQEAANWGSTGGNSVLARFSWSTTWSVDRKRGSKRLK